MMNWFMDHRVMGLRSMMDRLSNMWQERVEWVRMNGRRWGRVATVEKILVVENLVNVQ